MAKKAKFAVGDSVKFLGYGEDVAEAERVLDEGGVYEIVEVNADEDTVSFSIDNPDFNAKAKESEKNSRSILVDVFFDEVELATEEDEAAEEEEAPAPKKGKAVAKAASKPAAKATAGKKKAAVEEEAEEAEEDEEEAPAPKKTAKATGKAAAKAPEKTVAKGKAPAKGKAVATKGKTAAKPKAEKSEESDELAPLENEDQEIVDLVEAADDILELATELVENSSELDYKLGGVLYHVRLSKAYQKVDKKYKENGGFGLYVKEHLNIEYRKAMYLIDIYYKFNLYGIDSAKVSALGWTKCSKIAAVMSEDTAEDLIELAETSSVADLTDAIKESYKTEGGTKGTVKKRVTFKFRLLEEAGTAVTEVIEQAAKDMGLKNLDDAFEHIVMEWAAEHQNVKPAKKAVTKATGKTTAKTTSKKVAAAEEEEEEEA